MTITYKIITFPTINTNFPNMPPQDGALIGGPILNYNIRNLNNFFFNLQKNKNKETWMAIIRRGGRRQHALGCRDDDLQKGGRRQRVLGCRDGNRQKKGEKTVGTWVEANG